MYSIFPVFILAFGFCGLLYYQKHLLMLLLYIEIMLLSVVYHYCVWSFISGTSFGYIFALYIITIAAVESALALSIIVALFKMKGSISMATINLLR